MIAIKKQGASKKAGADNATSLFYCSFGDCHHT
jgi:hypothetical protein